MFFPNLLLSSAEAPPIFGLLTMVLFSVVVVSLVLSRFKQSLMAGYFLCGVLLANSGLIMLTGQTDNINTLSEIGVILLMFTIGIEFSVDELKHLRKFSFIGGGIQIAICTLVYSICIYVAGMPLNTSIVLALIAGLSSTAVALKSFQETNKTGTVAAKLALGIALFQDILAILLMATLPKLFATTESVGEALWGVASALGMGALFLVFAAFFGKYILPRIMAAVAHTRSRELFTVSVLALCACIAMLGSFMGLSLALGAFAAGVVVSGSYYSHRVLSEIMPFRDVFLTIFFVSAGLMVEIDVVLANWQWVLLGVVGVCSIKFISVLIAASRLKMSGSLGALAASSVSNVGEFSLVIVVALNLLSPLPHGWLQCIFAIAAISMGSTPAIMRVVMKYGHKLDRLPGFRRKRKVLHLNMAIQKMDQLEGHAIICGYGPVGKRLHESLTSYGIDSLIVDLNADTIKKLLSSGVPALLGDIRHGETMSLIGVSRARLVAFTFPDIVPALAAQPELRALNSSLFILARAKFPSEVERLWNAGIRTVIHDEKEVGAAMEHVALSAFTQKALSDTEMLNVLSQEQGKN